MSLQFYGYSFYAFMHFVIFLAIFKPYVMEETIIEKHYNANECVRWIEAFIANLGHPLWGSQSMLDLASLMRKGRTLLIPDANSCIDCEPHKGFAMNASEIWNYFLKIMNKSEKMKDSCASKTIPIKLYTHLLCTTKIIHECSKKLLKMNTLDKIYLVLFFFTHYGWYQTSSKGCGFQTPGFVGRSFPLKFKGVFFCIAL